MCSKKIKRGENVVVAAIANHIPYVLLRDFEENNGVRQITMKFFNDMRKKLDKLNGKVTTEVVDDAIVAG